MTPIERRLDASLPDLRRRLANARGLDQRLALSVLDVTCPRYPGTGELGTYRRVRELIEVQAWLDVAALLLACRLPRCRTRQIYWEEGAWHCTLTLAWTPVPWLGRTLVTAHPALELALLLAVVEGLGRGAEVERPFANIVPLRRPADVSP